LRASAVTLDTAALDSVFARPQNAGLSCPHCRGERVSHWGTAHGIPRYRCGDCRRTFNLLTNTPLARLRNKERWLTYIGTMFERKSIRKSAAACGVSATTSSRWHKRFMECSASQRAKIVREVLGNVSKASALSALASRASAKDATWARDLLPIVLSWLA
jgi:transposase-like protein